MKKTLFHLFYLVTLTSFSQIIGENLILHLNFNNNSTQDKSTYQHNVINHNATFNSGVDNTALNLNGNNSYLEITNSKSLEITNALTISLWYQHKTQKNSSSFYSIIEQSANEDGGHSRYGIWVIGNQLYFCIEPNTCPQSLCQRCISKSITLVEDDWYHLASSYDGNTLKIFLNNQVIKEQTYSSNSGISVKPYPLTIGTDIYDTNPNYLKASLDEIQLYDIALSTSQISKLFNQFSTASITKFYSKKIDLYPNPTSETIKIKSSINLKKVTILNINGQIIKELFLNDKNEINIKTLNKGIYLLRFSKKNTFYYKKLIVN